MAKSYVTEFVENIENSRQQLIINLQNKNQPASNSMTLGNLISLVNNINLEQVIPAYQRDPNLPDIDALFDADPLRKVNGGQYELCCYYIFRFEDGVSSFKITGGTSSKPIEKIVFSDGTSIENVTASTTNRTMEPNGIYTMTDGTKVGISKHYLTNIDINKTLGSISASYYINEKIVDTLAINIQGSNEYLDYVRTVGSNVTSLSSTSDYLCTAKCIRVDCDFSTYRFFHKGSYCGHIGTLEFIGNYIGSQTLNIGGAPNISSSGSYINYLKLPEMSGTSKTVRLSIDALGLYITDTIEMINVSLAPALDTIHIGNGLLDSTSWSSSGLLTPTLKHVTTSPNIFSKNTNAITINFSQCYYLTKQSLLNILNGLADRTDMTANKIIFSSNSKSLLSDEEIAIATNKNWTLA